MSTRDEIVGLVVDVLDQALGSISLGDRFLEDLGASSLDIVTLVMRIEQKYALGETSDADLEQIETVGDLVSLVESIQQPASMFDGDVVGIAIASDHAGVELKASLIEWFRKKHYSYIDLGPMAATSVDYPDFAALVARRIQSQGAERGILICGSGLGMSMAANRFKGVRAALVHEPLSASLSREHNDANVLCLGARLVGEDMARACIEAFMETDFVSGSDGRHRRRVQAMDTSGSLDALGVRQS